MAAERIALRGDFITLQALLKLSGAADTGGQAKWLISSGTVLVNGEVETRRGRKLTAGDRIEVSGVGRWVITHGGS
jgi:ribosome-associated protein